MLDRTGVVLLESQPDGRAVLVDAKTAEEGRRLARRLRRSLARAERPPAAR